VFVGWLGSDVDKRFRSKLRAIDSTNAQAVELDPFFVFSVSSVVNLRLE